MRGNWRRRCATAGAVVLACSGWSFADHFSATWTLNGAGSWTEPANWSTNPNFPNNNGDTYDATIAVGTAVVSLDDAVSIQKFTHSAGTFTGGGTLSVNGAALWDGGNIAGTGRIIINDTLDIDGFDRVFSLTTIDIDPAATVLWVAANINSDDGPGGGGIINNAGLFEDITDDGWFWGNVLSPVFNNSGEYRKSDGTAGSEKAIWAAFNNTGLVDVQAGDLWLAGGGASGGSFSVADGARLMLSDFNELFGGAGAPTTTFSSSAVINSLGTVVFASDFGNATTEFAGTYDSALTIIDTDDPVQEGNGGIVRFLSGAMVNSGTHSIRDLEVRSGTVRYETGQAIFFSTVTLTGGVIDTSDDLLINTIEWSGGTIQGEPIAAEAITNVSTGSLQFVGTDPKSLIDVNFFNGIGSTATISEGSLSMTRSRIIGLQGSTFDFQGSAILSNDGVDNQGTDFTNSGLLVKSAGTGAAELNNLYLSNLAEVRVEAGTLRLNGGGNHNGSITIVGGTTLELGAGAHLAVHEFQSGAILTGETGSHLAIMGETTFYDGSSTNVDGLSVNNAYVLFDGGELAAGAMSMDNGSSVNLSPGGNKTLKVKSIAIVEFSESQLDIADNKMIVDYDPIASESEVADQIRQYIQAGHNGGSWDGERIVTTLGDATEFALGYGENSVLGFQSFGGYDVDADSVLIKYTYYGDANLDGEVDLRDLYMLSLGWLGTGLWTDGDFNYDGLVDKADLTLLAKNWQAGNGAPLGVALEELGLPAVSVPEPSTLSILPLASALLLRRRPRQQ